MSDRGVEAPVDVRLGSSTNALQPVLAAERPLGAGRLQWILLLSVAGAALVADQLTKQVVTGTLGLGDQVDLVWPLSLHHVKNSGIAFGLFGSQTTIVSLVTGAAVGWMLWFFARSGRRHPMLPVALGLVLGGSVANLLDRVRLGYVTDFLDVGVWPAFNLADTFIVVGVGLLFGTLVLGGDGRRGGHAPLHRD